MHAPSTERYGMQVFWSDADQGYYAVFPEVPRISGFGHTPEQALAELREVLEAVVEVYREEGWPLPARLGNASTGRPAIPVDCHGSPPG